MHQIKQNDDTSIGAQRLSLENLQRWEALKFGMFIHFGMSTFDGVEHSAGDQPSTLYAPDKLDISQWIGIARDTGMKYAVLTTKHFSGHCLWPSQHNDYNVSTSGNRTDVVDSFVVECRKAGLLPGFYYSSADNHNRFGSSTPTFTAEGAFAQPANWKTHYATRAYEEFHYKQMEELATRYGEIMEFWIDIPTMLSAPFRHELYARLAELQPQSVIVMNKGVMTGGELPFAAWPTDVLNYETEVPGYHIHAGGTVGHQAWREVERKKYYLPGEVCDTVNPHWFWVEGDQPKSDAELLGQALLCQTRGCNLLLNVSPDRHGLVPPEQATALQRLRRNLDLICLS